eukprot:1158790-Pelagomonas_calceolata.AAC.6
MDWRKTQEGMIGVGLNMHARQAMQGTFSKRTRPFGWLSLFSSALRSAMHSHVPGSAPERQWVFKRCPKPKRACRESEGAGSSPRDVLIDHMGHRRESRECPISTPDRKNVRCNVVIETELGDRALRSEAAFVNLGQPCSVRISRAVPTMADSISTQAAEALIVTCGWMVRVRGSPESQGCVGKMPRCMLPLRLRHAHLLSTEAVNITHYAQDFARKTSFRAKRRAAKWTPAYSHLFSV